MNRTKVDYKSTFCHTFSFIYVMKNDLKIEEIMEIELQGVVNTINDYTREHFVRNYTKILLDCKYPKDKDKILSLVYRLIDWYTEKYEEISTNKHIYNRHEHIKAIGVLNRLLEILLRE